MPDGGRPSVAAHRDVMPSHYSRYNQVQWLGPETHLPQLDLCRALPSDEGIDNILNTVTCSQKGFTGTKDSVIVSLSYIEY